MKKFISVLLIGAMVFAAAETRMKMPALMSRAALPLKAALSITIPFLTLWSLRTESIR